MVAGNLEEGVSDLVSELERERTTKRTLMEDIRLLEVKLAEMQESEAEVVRLRSNLGGMSDLASELERERTTNRALREETELLKVRLAEAQTEARESETEVVRLRGELEEGISDLVSELERERMTNRTLKNEPKLFEVKLAEEKQLEMAAVRLRRKLEGMSDLVSELGRGGTTSSTLRKGTRLLEVKVTEAQTEAQKSETAVVRLRRKLEGMSDLVSELERERTANRTLRKETKLLEGKCGEAQTEADKSEMAVARLRRKLEGMSVLESELERERTTNRTLRKETKLLEGKRAEAQTGAQKSEAEVVQLRKKLREANANYKSAASSAEEALGRVQSHRKASEKKDAEIRELRATVKQKGNEVIEASLSNRRSFLTRRLLLSCRVVFGKTNFRLWPDKPQMLLRIQTTKAGRGTYTGHVWHCFSSRINHVTPECDRNNLNIKDLKKQRKES